MGMCRGTQVWGGAGLMIGLGLMLSGCDYWPPALQTQIEQLRSELQNATMEKTQLQSQMSSLAKVKDDLQAQVDDLSRANRDKSSMINSLQNSLASVQERLAKLTKAPAAKASAAKPAPKPVAKPVSKAPVKKKPAGVH
jgi:peptidoglycan hydrolase CwlO-like protein